MNLGTNTLVAQFATMASSVVDSVNRQRLTAVGLCADGLQRAATGLHLAREEDLRNVRARVHKIERALPSLLHTGLGKSLPADPRPVPAPVPEPEPPLPPRASVPPPTTRGARPPRRSFARTAAAQTSGAEPIRREVEGGVGDAAPVPAAAPRTRPVTADSPAEPTVTPTTSTPETATVPARSTAQKTATKKTTAQKTVARKTTARKTAARKTAAKKTTAKKTAAGGTAARKTAKTTSGRASTPGRQPTAGQKPAEAGAGTGAESSERSGPVDPAAVPRHRPEPVTEAAPESGGLAHE